VEAIGVDNLNVTAAVPNKVCVLQCMGNVRHAVSTRTNHLCHQFLRELEPVAAPQVPNAQQPARQSCLNCMNGVTTCRLLRLYEQCLPMMDESFSQGYALVSHSAKLVNFDDRCSAGQQHNRFHYCDSAKWSKDAVAANHRNLYPLSCFEFHNEGKDSSVREVGARDGLTNFEQRDIFRKVHDPKMWTQGLEITFVQRME
jgi:hypothetical protein